MATKVLWYVILALSLVSVCRTAPGLLRVPKVYNAIINSDDNLTPSRAFPLIQPVLHDTPLGYPLGPVIYQPQQLPYEEVDHKQAASSNAKQQLEDQNVRTVEPPKRETEPPQEDKNNPKTPQKPPAQPSDPALKLNENGLPPSLVPVHQYSPKIAYPYEPYNPYTPYYTDPYSGILLPYNNPYNPYYSTNPFGPFVFQPSFYNLPPTYQRPPPQQPLQPGLPPTQGNWDGPVQAPWQQPFNGDPNFPKEQGDHLGPSIPQQPSDINIKNNGNKNPSIPDVPPPPLPFSLPSSNSDSDKKSN